MKDTDKKITEKPKKNKNKRNQPQILLITGTPGTGKTRLARILAKKLKSKHILLNREITERKIFDSYDKGRKTFIVPEKKIIILINQILSKEKRMGWPEYLIIDSHMSHFFPAKKTKMCIITQCELPELKKRLKKRGYSKNKIRENLDSEIFEVCKIEAANRGHNEYVVNTTKLGKKKLEKQIKTLLQTIKRGKKGEKSIRGLKN